MPATKNEKSEGTREEVLLTKYKLYSRDIKRLLIMSGICPSLHPMLKILITFFWLAIMSFALIGTLHFCFHHINNIMVFTKLFGVAISLFGVILKICTFLLHQDNLAYLNNELSAFFLRDLDNPDYQALALHYYPTFANLFYSLTATVGVVCFVKIWENIIVIIQGTYLSTMPVMYPFEYEPGSLVDLVIQAAQIIRTYVAWIVTGGVDSAFGFYAFQVCGEFRVLARKFENLKASLDYQKDIQECIRRHHMLMRSLDTLERIFSILVFWLAITSAVIQCTFMFQMTVMLKTSTIYDISYTVAYISLKLVQAFAYCWYGTLIAEESELCLNAMYNAAWAGSGDKQIMNDVLIVLSQRPMVFTAKGCLQLRMEIFLKILNASISYFFLLRGLDEDVD